MIGKTFNGVKNLLIGLGVTFKNLFSTPVTFSYPEEKRIMPERFRGLQSLFYQLSCGLYPCCFG